MQQFTDKAKTALQLAAKAAKDLHQSYMPLKVILQCRKGMDIPQELHVYWKIAINRRRNIRTV